jgi:hypothetical protein
VQYNERNVLQRTILRIFLFVYLVLVVIAVVSSSLLIGELSEVELLTIPQVGVRKDVSV